MTDHEALENEERRGLVDVEVLINTIVKCVKGRTCKYCKVLAKDLLADIEKDREDMKELLGAVDKTLKMRTPLYLSDIYNLKKVAEKIREGEK